MDLVPGPSNTAMETALQDPPRAEPTTSTGMEGKGKRRCPGSLQWGNKIIFSKEIVKKMEPSEGNNFGRINKHRKIF